MRQPILLILMIFLSSAILAQTSNNRRPVGRDAYLKHRIAAGAWHSLEIRNGTLWAWGNNWYGEVGDGTSFTRNSPVQIGNANDWIYVSAGKFHSLGIRGDGTLWGWGTNGNGELGNGTNTNKNVPTQIGADNNWRSVSGGAYYSLGIKSDGTLWAWGDNTFGQLGDSTTLDRYIPVQIGNDSNWIYIRAGGGHSLGLKADGTVWTWGHNWYGQLGNGTNVFRSYPTQISNPHNWISIAAGDAHNLAIKSDGILWGWGHNTSGRIGDSTNINRFTPVQVGVNNNWVDITAGLSQSLGIRTNGELLIWGAIINYPVPADTLTNWTSIYAGSFHFLGRKTDGTLWRKLGNYSPTQISIDEVWVAIAAGDGHSLGIKADGSLWAWGVNTYGQLGDSTYSNKIIHTKISDTSNWKHIAAGQNHSLAIRADGTLWGWGRNDVGQLGDGTSTDKIVPTQVDTAHNWVSVSTSAGHSLGIKSDGTLWAWGYNLFGQLGDSTNTSKNSPVQIDTAHNWISIATGLDHSIGLKSDGTLWTWGRNHTGQLGIGASSNKTVPVQVGAADDWVAISAGWTHNLALKADGTLWAWGGNLNGSLGDGTNTGKNTPVQIGATANWVNIRAGYGASFGIKADGTLWAWGANIIGGLGIGNNNSSNAPIQVGTANNWVDIAPGYSHSLGLRADREKICATGFNYFGALGNGNTINSNTFYCSCTPSVISAQPANTALCGPDNTHFRIKAKYANTYQWQVNIGSGWVNINSNAIYRNVKTDSLILKNVGTAYNNNLYRCIVYNYCGDSVISESGQLTFISAPIITNQPMDTSVCSSTMAAFRIEATNAPHSYQWQVYEGNNWSNIVDTGIYNGATNDTLKLTAVPVNLNNYKYRCIVGNACTPPDTSSIATLTVDSTFVTSVTISGDTDICTGQTGNFTATPVNGGTNPVFQWQVAGINVGTNSTSFSTSSLANGNVVRCIMTSDVRCPAPKVSFSNGIGVQVTQNVTPTISITSDRGTSWCSGKENIFRSANTNGGSQPWYQWKINGVDIGPDADTLWVPYLNDGDVVECGMASSAKCPLPDTVNSNKINMTIVPTTKSSIIIMPNPDSIVCKDEDVIMYCAFTNGGTTPAFQWMLNGKDIPGETMGTFKTASLNNGDIINCRFISSGTCVFPEVSNPVSFVVNPEVSPAVSITVLYVGNNQHLFTALPVNGGTNPVYRWYMNGKQLKDEYSSAVTIIGLTRTDKVWVEMASSECVAANMRLVSSKKITTGIEENHTAFKTLVLHPNPTKDIFVVQGDLALASVQEVNMTILNNIGQVMHRERVPVLSGKLNYTVTTKDLPPGGYLLKLDYDGGQDFSRFVIVR